MNRSSHPIRMNLRPVDPETARVVAILDKDSNVLGAGCLLNGKHVLTCEHVVADVLSRGPRLNDRVNVRLIGLSIPVETSASVIKIHPDRQDHLPQNDLILLKLGQEYDLPDVQFATPLRHSGKRYSVLGFPDGDLQGRNASGRLHGINASGLVQMDGNSSLFVKGGFSGAPVWSSDLKAFVGIVVSELNDMRVAWCIPSSILCKFVPELKVRFRISKVDRPTINDREVDDPNIDLFGTCNNHNGCSLTASVKGSNGSFKVKATYTCNRKDPKGRSVTFITYPDFESDNEDAYELYSDLELAKDTPGAHVAETVFYPEELFTMAAIGDGGNTVLTLDLEELCRKRK